MTYTTVNPTVPRPGDYIKAEGPEGQQVVVLVDGSEQLNPGGAVRIGELQSRFSGVVADAPDSLLAQHVQGVMIGAENGSSKGRLIPPPDGWGQGHA